jgi:catechol 2,3-dioxygenase-like lactoylglutathione lyase family enzyme
MIKCVKFVSVAVSDQDRALAFYTEKLGFKVLTDQPFGEGRRWIELTIGGAETRFVLSTPGGQEEDRVGNFFNGALACDDVERTFSELRERGVEFVSEPKREPWGTFAVFKDPDGNQFVLASR